MKQISGFTLIELLVAVSIFAVLLVVLAQTFFTVIRLSAKAEIYKEVKQNGDFALLTMSRLIRNAAGVDCLKQDPEYVHQVTLSNFDGGTTTLGCAIDGLGVTHIASTSADAGDELLTTGSVSVGPSCEDNNLYFRCTPQGEVYIVFQLSQKSAEADPCPVADPQALASSSARQFERACVVFATSVIPRNN